MSQSYFHPRNILGTATTPGAEIVQSPSAVSNEPETAPGRDVEEIQESYVQHKNQLIGAIDSTQVLLKGIREFNNDQWVVRYPQLAQPTEEESSKSTRRGHLRRSLTFADDPSLTTEVIMTSSKPGMARAMTMEPASSLENIAEVGETVKEEDVEDSGEVGLQLLRLDLKLGHASTASSLVAQIDKSSIANLLDDRIDSALKHVQKLRNRIEDTSSKVLVTGDLNAGKSTFVNALLRREVMPVDQQPCTTMFCEVHDAIDNNGVEEVHVVKEGFTYALSDESTFTRAPLSDLQTIVDSADPSKPQGVLKLYVTDMRAPSESLIHNGIVDIALIDAPGLNRDSLKTTALFARQEEIDVVVFVVSAENHFTLSAKEFLWNASNEKAYLFIVVNRFDQIRDKEKCKRLVLEQIKQMSPRTWDDAKDLVHFVDSSVVQNPGSSTPSFENLEAALRSFVLVKRSKSKLNPATTYLNHLLSDIDFLASANSIVASQEADRARADLEQTRPVLEKMQSGREQLEDSLEIVEEEGATTSTDRAKEVLNVALERIARGEPAVDQGITMPPYPGLLNLWDYAQDVRRALLASLDSAVKLAENEARVATSYGVKKISQLEEAHLPIGVERNRRIFVPEAMFSPRFKKGQDPKARRRSSAIVAGGTHGLGLGLAQRSELLEVTFFDLFDAQHYFSVHFGHTDGQSKKVEENNDDSTPSALSVMSLGMGAISVVGGKTLGARGIFSGLIRISDFFGNESTRRWAVPVIGFVTLGAAVYFVLELPNTIPKNIGRRIKASLAEQSHLPSMTIDGTDNANFVSGQSARISRETRKVLRIASWDLRERFRSAMEDRAKEVREKEEIERRAKRALEYFSGVREKAGEVRFVVGDVATR
ncbi:hypothetical protein SISNIDRAFT_454256 [Sistotremastrum niveocremeum HHB9708]|uniref:Dynamin-type G domain-containing protein n=1 Tax=Sistotremastrum niveocremeum HHB9708 TaxID=1314777 RepID=A0A164V4K7_9AGAM|nr:hypothetical protein SISNIDRAFT_454256 [Sistotremastrum niveocremeum HHB9708]